MVARRAGVGAVIAVLVAGNALAFVPVIACALMMMGGVGGRRVASEREDPR